MCCTPIQHIDGWAKMRREQAESGSQVPNMASSGESHGDALINLLFLCIFQTGK